MQELALPIADVRETLPVPGMGKRDVPAAWLARREAAGEIVPHHVIRRDWANWDDPEELVCSLVAQIKARFKPTSAPAESPRSERPEVTIAPATGLPRASATICAPVPEDANLVTIEATAPAETAAACAALHIFRLPGRINVQRPE